MPDTKSTAVESVVVVEREMWILEEVEREMSQLGMIRRRGQVTLGDRPVIQVEVPHRIDTLSIHKMNIKILH
jgi:hypothetical protein